MKLTLVPLLASLLLCAVPAINAESAPARSDSRMLAQGGGLTLDQAVEQVRRQYNGRIVSAETRVSGNRETHYIKVLQDDGKVITVTVPGRNLGKSKS
ncbi:MAG TPA: PepSY domain-containing protein [Woeseiaceae bacterium]|nr:PepSY domain-containing protein [Woeseiaceae bacterium]